MHKIAILLFLCLIFSLIPSRFNAQFWGRNTESAFTNEAFDIEVDDFGNSYVTGYITGETVFQSGTVYPSAIGNGDIIVAKYSALGILLWTKKFGGNFSDRAYDLAIDENNEVVICGQYYGTVAFDNDTLVSVSNSKDIFLVKLNANGSVLWALSEGGAGPENAYGITCDNANNIILTGQFQGNSVLGGVPHTSTFDPVLNIPSYDMFISKYNASGIFQWIHTGVADYEDRGLAVAVDNNDNIYMTGQFSDTLVFAGQTFNNNAYNVGFVAKFNPSGNFQWLNKLQAGLVLPYDLDVNATNEIIVVGDFKGNMYYQTSTTSTAINNVFAKKIFALCIGANGNHIWNQTLGSNNDVSARSISINNLKDIYITGYFKCDFTELHTPTAYFNSVGFKDIYLWKLNSNGVEDFVQQFGGKKDDEGHGVAILNDKAIICGSYTNDLNFPIDPLYSFGVNISLDAYNLNGASGYEPPHVYLNGDESRNSFLCNVNEIVSTDYNYFINSATDSLVGEIVQLYDTAAFCAKNWIEYWTKTHSHFGPGFDYLWENGLTYNERYIPVSGTYSIEVTRWDECSVGFDTVFVNPVPILPLMSDNLGLAVLEPGEIYYAYQFCHPDSVGVFFTNLNPTYNMLLMNPQNDTLLNDTTLHFHEYEGSYSVVVTDTNYCHSEGYFAIDLEFPTTYDIDPYVLSPQDPDFNDSISVCINEQVEFDLLDFTNNFDSTFHFYSDDTIIYYQWHVNGVNAGGGDTNELSYSFDTSGYYIISYYGIVGYMNTCGIDTMHFSASHTYYIEVLPLPSANTVISADNLLCPNGSVYLTLSNAIPGLTWSGPPNGIQSINSTGDSVLVAAAGTYGYSGTMTDTINGCSNNYNFIFTLYEKVPPTISAYPDDGIICPYDSVEMFVTSGFVTYDWTGPNGFNLSNTEMHIDDDAGFYYCTVLDIEGCYLTSPPFELKELTSPYLIVEPSNILCAGETATIQAVFIGEGTAQWISPVVSNAESIVVSQAGWYVCSLEQCGITVLDSIEIIDGSFTITISTSDSLLCYQENTVLQSNPSNLTSYDWSNGGSGSFLVVDEQGNYSVTAINNYGCEASSNSIIIDQFELSVPPENVDTFICEASDVFLNLAPENLNWFTNDTAFLQLSQNFTLLNIAQDTSLLISYDVPECAPVFATVEVSMISNIPAYDISGDTSACTSDSLQLQVNSQTETVNWFVNNIFMGDQNTLNLTYSVNDPLNSIVICVISNQCLSDTLIQNVYWMQADSVQISTTDLIVCQGENLSFTVNNNFSVNNWSGSYGIQNTQVFDINNIQNSGSVYFQGTDMNGCLSNIDTVNITVPTFNYQINSNNLSACLGDSVEVFVTSNADSVIWTTPNATIIGDTLSFSMTQQDTGWYYLALYDVNGCVHFDSLQIDNISIIGNDSIFGDTVACSYDNIVLQTNADAGLCTWYFNGLAFNNQNQFVSVYNGNPTENIMLIINAPCYSDTLYQTIYYHVPELLEFDIDSLTACASDLLSFSQDNPNLTLTWSGIFGNINSDTLTLLGAEAGETILISAIDSNGCFTNEAYIYLNIHEIDYEVSNNIVNSCEGDTVIFSYTSTSIVDTVYWSSPNGYLSSLDTFILSQNTSGLYVLNQIDTFGCLFIEQFEIFNHTFPINGFPEDTIMCLSTELILSTENETEMTWTQTNSNGTLTVLGDETWYFTLTSEFGCVIEDSIMIDEVNCEDLLPNVITPNGDGINDFLIIDEAPLYPNNYLIIINRWGNVVYEIASYKNDFNGDDLVDGTYFYIFYREGRGSPNYNGTQTLDIRRN